MLNELRFATRANATRLNSSTNYQTVKDDVHVHDDDTGLSQIG